MVAVAAVAFVVGVLVGCGCVVPVVVTGLVVAPKVGLRATPTVLRDAPLVAALLVSVEPCPLYQYALDSSCTHLVTVAVVLIATDAFAVVACVAVLVVGVAKTLPVVLATLRLHYQFMGVPRVARRGTFRVMDNFFLAFTSVILAKKPLVLRLLTYLTLVVHAPAVVFPVVVVVVVAVVVVDVAVVLPFGLLRAPRQRAHPFTHKLSTWSVTLVAVAVFVVVFVSSVRSSVGVDVVAVIWRVFRVSDKISKVVRRSNGYINASISMDPIFSSVAAGLVIVPMVGVRSTPTVLRVDPLVAALPVSVGACPLHWVALNGF